jgi:hypothetical protein
MLPKQNKNKDEVIDEAEELRRLYRWSFAVRFGFGLAAWGATQFLNIGLVKDAGFYQQIGEELAQDWMNGDTSVSNAQQEVDARAGRSGMVYVIAAFYYITNGFGSIPLLLAFYSALTAWTPVFTYRICRELGASVAAARIAGRLVAFSPIFALWSALYKEGLIFLLMNIVVYYALRLQKQRQLRSVGIIFLCLLGIFALRFYLAVMIMPIITVSLLFVGQPEQKDKGNKPTKLLLFLQQGLIVAILVLILGQVGFFEQALELGADYIEDPFGNLQTMRDDLSSSSASGYLEDADVSTPEAALAFLPVGLMYFLTGPLPWQFGGVLQNIAIPETTFWLLLYPLVLSGMKQGLRRNFQGSVLLLAMSIAISCLFALISGNLGIAYRMRSQVWLLWAVFAGWGWEERRLKKEEKRRFAGKFKNY